MKSVARLAVVLAGALLLTGLGASGIAGRALVRDAAASSPGTNLTPAPGDVPPLVQVLSASGGRVTETSAPLPAGVLAGSCTFTVLPNDNSTSGNARCPMLRFRFERSVYLITAAELAANGLSNGASITGIGWNLQTANGVTGSAPLIVYLQNTSDATNTKSTTWTTAISGMTTVHNATTTFPSPAGTFDIPFSGGSPFTYTGGGIYVAFDFGNYAGTLSATSVAWCNSLGLVNGLLGNQSTTSAPTTLAASSFRPETRFTAGVANNDAAVAAIQTLGTVPLGLTGPLPVQAIVTNKGSSTLTNVPVTLTVTGADTYTETQTLSSLTSCGGQTTVTFTGFTPSNLGTDNLTVSVPSDDINTNNSRSQTLAISLPNYSYKIPASTATGGFGLNAAGAIVDRFSTTAPAKITAVNLEFAATSATTYKVVIYADASAGLGIPGSQLYLDAANRTVSAAGPVTITLPSPVTVGPGNFFVGIQQTNATNAALSFDTEAPVRAGTFFLAGQLPPSTWIDFAPGNNFKPNIGVILDRCNITPTASNNGPICNGNTLQLFANAAGAASYSWTGPGGFTSAQQNPTIPSASSANSGTYTVTVNGCASGATTAAVVNGPYTITSSANAGGTISPSTSVNCGASATFAITPGSCSSIADVLVDGVSVGAVSSYTFSNVSANHTIAASFSLIQYTITASAGSGGSISPSGAATAACGSSATYTITPSVGYQIADVLVDGSSVGAVSSYAFGSVTQSHTIAASFALVTGSIAAQSPANTIGPNHPSVTVPITIARTYTNAVRAFTVHVQLSPELTLTSGLASITEGSYLNGAASTSFHVIDNGGGSYTVDDAILGGPCGPTDATGTLFNLAVSSSTPAGTGTVSVSSASLRDCGNQSLAIASGAPAPVAIDNQPPVVTVTSPNGGESWNGNSAQTITWTATDNVSVANVDLAYSTDSGANWTPVATAIANSGSYAWTVPLTLTTHARVRVTAHDVNGNNGDDASDFDFTISGATIGPVGAQCITPAQSCITVPVNITRTESTSMLAYHVRLHLSPNVQLCAGLASITEGSYLNASHQTSFQKIDHGGNEYSVDATTLLPPCGVTTPSGTLFSVAIKAIGPGAWSVTVDSVIVRDCDNNDIPAVPGPPASGAIDATPVAVAPIPHQTVVETNLLTVVPSATLSACAAGPVTWSIAPAPPAGSSFDPATGTLNWTPPCGSAGNYGPFTVTATDANGNFGSASYAITVTHRAGGVTVAVSDPPATDELSLITVTPSATLGPCATGPVTWSIAPPLPGGASFSSSSGEVQWTPSCGQAGSYGPFTLTAMAATGETGTGSFTIVVNHKTGGVTVSVSDPPATPEESNIHVTPGVTLGPCAAGPVTWSIAPALPAGATLSSTTGEVDWLPSCGQAGSYGPFTLTATAATHETGTGSFSIVVTHKTGTVAVVATDQTVAEGATLNYTPMVTLTSCAANPVAWSATGVPTGASFDPATGTLVWTPGCSAFEDGPNYPVSLTATAATGESGSGSYVIHVTNTPSVVSAIADLAATQIKLGNDGDGTTKVRVTFTAPGGTTVEVYRAGFGHYPQYDDLGGAVPTAPSYPPAAPWTLTSVTASGQDDETTVRDFYYYVAFVKNGCGDVSTVSNMTGGTLNYHLGDVTDGFTAGQGDNLVRLEDVSLLGAHYGASGGALAGYEYLDVGPTTDHSVNARPVTDARLNFDDLIMFALNYGLVSGPSTAARPVVTQHQDLLRLQVTSDTPGRIVAHLYLDGSGSAQGISTMLQWNHETVEPISAAAGSMLTAQDGVAMSAQPGNVDVAILGNHGYGLYGSGEIATITFAVKGDGDFGIAIGSVTARNPQNGTLPVGIEGTTAVNEVVPTHTALAPASPNPFPSGTSLAFSLAKASRIELDIFSVDGRHVRTLASGMRSAGEYRETWDGRSDLGAPVGAGVYYARLSTGPAQYKQKLVRLP